MKELQTPTKHTRIAWSEYLHFPHSEIKVLYKVTCNIKGTHLNNQTTNWVRRTRRDSKNIGKKKKYTYIKDQTHGFHLVREVESVLQASSFHGANDEVVECVPGWLYTIQHHILVHIPQQERPTTTTNRHTNKRKKTTFLTISFFPKTEKLPK